VLDKGRFSRTVLTPDCNEFSFSDGETDAGQCLDIPYRYVRFCTEMTGSLVTAALAFFLIIEKSAAPCPGYGRLLKRYQESLLM